MEKTSKVNNGFAKSIAIFLIFLLTISLTLAAMKKIDFMYFWIIAGISAIIAWKVLPKINK
jgi:hypothetical protein